MSGNRLDDIAPAFRAAVERWPDAPNLQQHYRDLARAWEGEGSSVIELIKSFLECVCWTVLNELGASGPNSTKPNTHQILRSALDALGLSNHRGYGPFDDLISGLNKVTKSIDDLRRNDGSVAHGKDAFIDSIHPDVLRAYINAVDAIITTILYAYDGKTPNIRTTREPVTRWAHLNDRINLATSLEAQIDEEGSKMTVRIYCTALEEPIEMLLTPAELLYELYRDAYVEVLEALQEAMPAEEEESTELIEEEVGESGEFVSEEEPAVPSEPVAEPVRQQLLDDYQGRFREKVHLLYEFVVHQLLGGRGDQKEQVHRFVNTLLDEMEDLAVVDWSRREPKRAAVRVTLKRLIQIAAIDGLDEEAIEPLLDWLRREIENGNGYE